MGCDVAARGRRREALEARRGARGKGKGKRAKAAARTKAMRPGADVGALVLSRAVRRCRSQLSDEILEATPPGTHRRARRGLDRPCDRPNPLEHTAMTPCHTGRPGRSARVCHAVDHCDASALSPPPAAPPLFAVTSAFAIATGCGASPSTLDIPPAGPSMSPPAPDACRLRRRRRAGRIRARCERGSRRDAFAVVRRRGRRGRGERGDEGTPHRLSARSSPTQAATNPTSFLYALDASTGALSAPVSTPAFGTARHLPHNQPRSHAPLRGRSRTRPAGSARMRSIPRAAPSPSRTPCRQAETAPRSLRSIGARRSSSWRTTATARSQSCPCRPTAR